MYIYYGGYPKWNNGKHKKAKREGGCLEENVMALYRCRKPRNQAKQIKWLVIKDRGDRETEQTGQGSVWGFSSWEREREREGLTKTICCGIAMTGASKLDQNACLWTTWEERKKRKSNHVECEVNICGGGGHVLLSACGLPYLSPSLFPGFRMF